MFDKELFFSLCEKYNVEFSKTESRPMIKDDKGVHALTDEDVYRIFRPCQDYFRYSDNKIGAKVISEVYYLPEDFAIAC